MSQLTVYRSTDPTAPVLTGQAGALIALLDACLVNGYGAKVPAGWTKAFSGTNKAAYRMGGGIQSYLRVDDSTTSYATTRGFLSMTDVDTGTGDFPAVAQTSLSYAIKSNAADATARAWTLFADNKTFYLYVITGNPTSGITSPQTSFGFGRFDSLLPADPYDVMIASATTTALSATSYNNAALQAGGPLGASYYYPTPVPLQIGCLYTPGTLAGAQNSTPLGIALSSGLTLYNPDNMGSPTGVLVGGLRYPHGTDGGLYLGRQILCEGSPYHLRGFLRGLHHPLHPFTSFSNGTTFSGAGSEAGKAFEIVGPLHNCGSLWAANTKSFGWHAVETSNTLS